MVNVTNIVFVHGAWADGSCWSKVIVLLSAKGFKCTAVQLGLSNTPDDVASATRIINAQDGPLLLAGHSYGGAVITQAGNNPKVAGLMYVAAFAPDEGESPISQASAYPTTNTLSEAVPIEDGYLVLSKKGVYDYFAQDLTFEEKLIVYSVQGATNGSLFPTVNPGPPAWKSKPNWYIVAEEDGAIDPRQERESAKRMGAEILCLPTSHLPMLKEPEKVADFILKAVATLSNE